MIGQGVGQEALQAATDLYRSRFDDPKQCGAECSEHVVGAYAARRTECAAEIKDGDARSDESDGGMGGTV